MLVFDMWLPKSRLVVTPDAKLGSRLVLWEGHVLPKLTINQLTNHFVSPATVLAHHKMHSYKDML